MATISLLSPYRRNAAEDAKAMQKSLERLSNGQNEVLKRYRLDELTGKGSFGRVYKSFDQETKKFVAIKIISIEQGDRSDPSADTVSDIRREIETLKSLTGSGAKNITTIIDEFLIGSLICVVTDFCAGGSVSTLMKPDGFVPEKWIIPMLREVAVGLHWVHSKGFVHRDIKCANVLVNDDGSVQLCDFGVAGIVETKYDKRTTFIGTLHWMAPEMFEHNVEYGKEVDIWALGCLIYEAATGFPPNARAGFRGISRLGRHLKENTPRLEGDQYSEGLRSFVASCMTEDRSRRPRIEEVQKHPFIHGTAARYPTASLSGFVQKFRVWEAHGGMRASLFSAAGAQREDESRQHHRPNDVWKFEDSVALEPTSAGEDAEGWENNNIGSRNLVSNRRRRRAPPQFTSLPTPLEKLFDPNTLTGYGDNAKRYYNGLPLRADFKPEDSTIRESLIDLDAAETTVRPVLPSVSTDIAAERRQVMGWKFPAAALPDGTAPYPASLQNGPPVLRAELGSSPTDNRQSSISLIDLDESIPTSSNYERRPSIATSETASTVSDVGSTSFGLEEKIRPSDDLSLREPSIYVDDILGFSPPMVNRDAKETDVPEMIPRYPSLLFEASTPSSPPGASVPQKHAAGIPTFLPSDSLSPTKGYSSIMPQLPGPPSPFVMGGESTPEGAKQELRRLLSSFSDHLHAMNGLLAGLAVEEGKSRQSRTK